MHSETSNFSILPEEVADYTGMGITSLGDCEDLNPNGDLQVLKLKQNNLSILSTEEFSAFPNLRFLDISKNQITKLQGISALSQLILLDASKNQIKVLENLEGNRALKRLLIARNLIQTVALLAPVVSLVVLDIRKNPIQRIDFAEKFPTLQELYIDSCLLVTLQGIEKFKSLIHLTASKNKIHDMKQINHPFLADVDVSDNKFTTIAPFYGLKSLVYLNVSGNDLTDVSMNLPGPMPLLRAFRCSGVQLKRASSLLALFPNIEIVDFSCTLVSSLEDLTLFVRGSPMLKYIDTRGTPLTEEIYPPHNPDDERVWASIFDYNDQYPGGVDTRKNYRLAILQASSGRLEILDQIRVVNEEFTRPSPLISAQASSEMSDDDIPVYRSSTEYYEEEEEEVYSQPENADDEFEDSENDFKVKIDQDVQTDRSLLDKIEELEEIIRKLKNQLKERRELPDNYVSIAIQNAKKQGNCRIEFLDDINVSPKKTVRKLVNKDVFSLKEKENPDLKLKYTNYYEILLINKELRDSIGIQASIKPMPEPKPKVKPLKLKLSKLKSYEQSYENDFDIKTAKALYIKPTIKKKKTEETQITIDHHMLIKSSNVFDQKPKPDPVFSLENTNSFSLILPKKSKPVKKLKGNIYGFENQSIFHTFTVNDSKSTQTKKEVVHKIKTIDTDCQTESHPKKNKIVHLSQQFDVFTPKKIPQLPIMRLTKNIEIAHVKKVIPHYNQFIQTDEVKPPKLVTLDIRIQTDPIPEIKVKKPTIEDVFTQADLIKLPKKPSTKEIRTQAELVQEPQKPLTNEIRTQADLIRIPRRPITKEVKSQTKLSGGEFKVSQKLFMVDKIKKEAPPPPPPPAPVVQPRIYHRHHHHRSDSRFEKFFGNLERQNQLMIEELRTIQSSFRYSVVRESSPDIERLIRLVDSVLVDNRELRRELEISRNSATSIHYQKLFDTLESFTKSIEASNERTMVTPSPSPIKRRSPSPISYSSYSYTESDYSSVKKRSKKHKAKPKKQDLSTSFVTISKSPSPPSKRPISIPKNSISPSRIQYPSHLNPHLTTALSTNNSMNTTNYSSMTLNSSQMNFGSCERAILNQARSITSAPIYLKEGNGEYKALRFWLSIALRKDVTIAQIIRAPSGRQLQNAEQMYGSLQLVLYICDNPTYYFNYQLPPSSILYRYLSRNPRHDVHSFLLCAADMGDQTQIGFEPKPDKVMQYQAHGYDSVIYEHNGIESILIFDSSRIVPLYAIIL